MLKTNSKAARSNILAYIEEHRGRIEEEHLAYEDFIHVDTNTPEGLCSYIINGMFYEEMLKHNKAYQARPYSVNVYDIFRSWAQGLSGCGMFDYYYNLSAVELLGNILEETEEERNRFTEEQAEEKLTYLIYRELTKQSEKEFNSRKGA